VEQTFLVDLVSLITYFVLGHARGLHLVLLNLGAHTGFGRIYMMEFDSGIGDV
jgi:hypothetical protein